MKKIDLLIGALALVAFVLILGVVGTLQQTPGDVIEILKGCMVQLVIAAVLLVPALVRGVTR